MDLPAYLLSSGLGSKPSRWLTPPAMKIQMTLLALGWKWGRPSGGKRGFSWAARPVKPIPVSARKDRRVTPLHFIDSPYRDEIVMVEEHVHQALPRSIRVVE